MEEFSANIIVGFKFLEEDVLTTFQKTLPEKSHLEDRYDQRTGLKLAEKAKVLDEEEREVWEFDGEVYEDKYDFFDAVASKINCEYEYFGEFGGETKFVSFCVPLINLHDSVDVSNAYFGGSIPYAKVAVSSGPLKSIKDSLESFGLRPGEPTVHLAWKVS